MKPTRFLTGVALLASCSSDLPHEAPFDPNAPLEKQAKATLSGTLRLEGETDFSQVTLDLQNTDRTYNVDTAADGAVSLTGIVPGEYTLKIRTRYFQPVTESLTVEMGSAIDLGTRTLPPLRSRVLGLATAEKIQGGELVTKGGVALSLRKTASVRAAVSKSPAYRKAAAVDRDLLFSTLSGSDGDFEFPEVPAGGYELSAATDEAEERVVGTVTVTGEGDVTVDPIVLRPLTGYFEILGSANGQPSSTYTSVAAVNLQLQQSNAVQVKVAVSTNGTTAGCDLANATPEALPSNTLRPLTFASEGKKLVCVSYVDADGKETAPIYGTITYDATPPTLPSVAINGGAQVVSSNLVTLSLSAVDVHSGVAVHKVHGVNDFSAILPKAFQPTDVYSLAGGDGLKTVWVVFGDHAGNYSAPVSASVLLDTIAPSLGGAVTLTKLDGTPLTSGDTIAESRVKLVSSVVEATPVLDMQITTNGSYAGQSWVPYDPAKGIDLPSGTSSISVRVRDGAGHVVELVTAFTLTTDTTPPTGTLVIAPTAVTDPAIIVQATGSIDAVAVELAFDPGFVTSLGNFVPGPIAVTLPAGDGTKTVYGRFFDAAGNASGLVGDTVVLDTTPPQILSYTLAQASPTKDNPITVNYSASGAAELRITEGLDCGGVREPVGAGTKSFTVSASEGDKEIRLQFFDAAGNASECAVRTIYYDPNPPVVGALQINYGQAATSSNVVTLSFPGVSGATKVMVSEDAGFAGADWQSFAATKTFTLSAGNGVKTAYAKVADEAGNTANLPSASITLDTTPPTSPSIFAAYDVTSQTSVLLTLSAGLMSEMWITQDDPSFTTGAWEVYSGTKVFALTGADGTKTIYAKFKKSTGVETAVVSDTVVLDRAAPILPNVQINGGALVVGSSVVTLSLSAVDTTSGLFSYKVNTVNDFSAVSPKPFQPTDVFSFAPGDGPKTVWVVFGDRAGHYSSAVSAMVVVDTAAPALGGAVTLTKLDGTPLTTGDAIAASRIVLNSSVSDSSSLQMQVTTNGSYSGVAWVPYEPSKLIDLVTGSSSISARVRDGAGLITDLVTAFALTVDTTPPTGSLVIAPTAVTDPAITVQATGSADAVEVELAFDPGFVTSLGRFTPGPIGVTLQPGDGVKTVYARFFDAAGNASALVGDTVTLDTTPPQILSYTLAQASPTKDNPVTVQYNVVGAAELRATEGLDCGGVREPVGAGTKSFTLSPSEGVKEIRLQFFDAAGNASECAMRAVVYDPNPPVVGTMELNYGQSATSSNVVTVSFAGVSGATKVMISEDPGFAGSLWDGYSATKTFVLSAGNGVKTVYAKVADDAGHVVNVPQATITLDTSTPIAPSIYAAVDVTTQTSVLLTLAAGVMQDMWLTQDDPNFTTGAWEAYSGSKAFTLSGADGTKTIYAKFRKSTGVETTVVSDTVILDRAAPTLPSVRVDGNASVVASASLVLNLSAVDASSGLATYKINTVNDFTAVSAEPFQSNVLYGLTGPDGLKTIWVTIGDKAGIYSAPVSTTVTLDTSAPVVNSAVVQTTGGTPLTSGSTIADTRVVLAASVTDLSALQMQVSTTGSFAGAVWEPYNPAKGIDLPAGPSTLAVRVRDAAGHVTDLITAFTVTVDNTPPSSPSLAINGKIAGAVSTTTVSVTLSVSADAVDAEIAYDPGFVTSLGSFAPNATHNVPLLGGDGSKSLYVRFFDAAGNESVLAGDTVILDTTPPIASFTIAEASPTKINPFTLNYTQAGATTFRVAEDATCGGALEAVGSGTKSFTVTASEGLKEVRMQFFDAVGNASACLVQSVYFDPNPPVVGALQINYGQAATSSNVVTLSFPGVSGATKVMVSEDAGFAGADWQAFATTKTFTLSPGNGVKTVYAKVADDAGHVVNLTQQSITLDTTPPTAPSIFVAYDVTSQTSVTVFVSAGLVSEMWITQDDPTFTTGAWETYSGSKLIALSGTDGTKTIYAKFEKSTGVETAVVSDTVILDRTAPILPSVQVNGGAAVVTSNIVTLNLSAVDSASGLYTYKVNDTNDFTALSPKPYQTSDVYALAGGDGEKTVWVTYGDRAGHYSTPVSKTVLLDTTNPSIVSAALQLGNASVIANGQTIRESRVYLATSVSDLTPLEMQITTNGSFTGIAWEPYAATKVIDLALPAGQTPELRNVQARVRDGAGHVVSLINIDVLLDTRAPTGTLTLTSPALTNNATVSLSLSANEAPSEAQLSTDPSFGGAMWFATVNTTFTLPAGDGIRTVYARFRDGAGNLSGSATVSLTLDQTSPALPSLSINNGAAATSLASGAVNLALSAVDSGSAVTHMKVANLVSGVCADALSPVAEEGYAASKAWTLDDAGAGKEGTRWVCAALRDGAGNWSASVSDAIAYDTAPPTVLAGGVEINGGDSYAVSTLVELSLTASGAGEVLIANGLSFSGSVWEPYRSLTNWFLPPAASEIERTVSVKFRDAAGNETAAYSDSITLDTGVPSSPTLEISGGAPYSTTNAVTLNLFAVGADLMRLSNDPAFGVAFDYSYATSVAGWALSAGDGIKHVYAQFFDNAGNASAIVSAQILLDTSPPTGADFSIVEAPLTPNLTIHLTLQATDATEMQIAEGSCGGAWRPFVAEASYSFQSAVDGVKTIAVRFRDAAGNTTGCILRSITLDSTAPYITSYSPRDGWANSIVTINGLNFGQFIEDGEVILAGLAMEIVSWSNSEILIKLPAGIAPGMYNLKVTADGKDSQTVSFLVGPSVLALSREAGVPGDTIVLSGTFGVTQGSVTLGAESMTINSWSTTQIEVEVPAGLPGGLHEILVYSDGIVSNTSWYTLLPRISSITPSSGTLASTVQIGGESFGSMPDLVYFGVDTAAVISWTPLMITVTPPNSPLGGAVPVQVVTRGVGSNLKTFTYTRPWINERVLHWGDAGSTVTLDGSSFGAGAGLVTVGGVNATGLVWSDTQIDLTVAAATPVRRQSIVVTTSGGTPSNAVPFTVRDNDLWVIDDSPEKRRDHVAVWTGREMLIWGGRQSTTNPANIGSRYNPISDSWLAMTITGAPASTIYGSAIWTGKEMITFGGCVAIGVPVTYCAEVNGGASGEVGMYDPAADSWQVRASVHDRYGHSAVWTGSRMLVFGGYRYPDGMLGDTLLYDPVADTWQTGSAVGAPSARRYHTAIWSGELMVVWGGKDEADEDIGNGAMYDPLADEWTAMNTPSSPIAMSNHAALWTGAEMIVWQNGGGRFNPQTNRWLPLSSLNAPATTSTVVWSGTEMLAWGSNPGGRYDPVADTWTPMSATAAPENRNFHTAVWTGTKMIVWGGELDSGAIVPTGGSYDPILDTWTNVKVSNAGAPRVKHSAVWSGSEMLIWGGGVAGGARYSPATHTWTAMTATNEPSSRINHSAIWSGTRLVIWGGCQSADQTSCTSGTEMSTGGRYNPATNSWLTTSEGTNLPAARYHHTATWTGSTMVVFGGVKTNGGTSYFNSGGRYNPTLNTWATMSATGVPGVRYGHSGVWTGTYVVVWGGYDGGSTRVIKTGGRYDPVNDTWLATSTGANSASPRYLHSAVWTGSQMLIFGGATYSSCPAPCYATTAAAGGVYDPVTDTWPVAMNSADDPPGRYFHSSVWSGTEMVVWGGYYQACTPSCTTATYNSGGRYDPVSNTWQSIAVDAGSPSARLYHTGVWTGDAVLYFGGSTSDYGLYMYFP